MQGIQTNIAFDNLSVNSEKPVSEFLSDAKQVPYKDGSSVSLPMSAYPMVSPELVTNNITYPPAQSVPVSSANGVNIVIYNPSVQPPNGTSSITNNYNQTYPKEYYTQSLAQHKQEPIKSQEPAVPQPTAQPIQAVAPIAAAPVAAAPAKPQKTKEIVKLTDNYIKTLEGYIKNPDSAEIRLMGAKELQERFKEDDSRKNDPALSSLLNVCLQDKDAKVRFRALTTLDSGWANGNSLTLQILNKMRTSKAVYGDDAHIASNVLLKIAGTKIKVPDTSTTTTEAKQK